MKKGECRKCRRTKMGMLATVSGMLREHGSPEQHGEHVQKARRVLDSKHLRAEWDVWPPKGQRHPIQQEGGNDFRTNRKSGMFDGQPSGCLFVGGRNRFVSRDESAAVITLRDGREKKFHVNI